MVFVLLKQSFATVLACFGRFVLINLVCKNNGRFSDTLTGIDSSENQERTYTTKHGTVATMKTGNIGIRPEPQQSV